LQRFLYNFSKFRSQSLMDRLSKTLGCSAIAMPWSKMSKTKTSLRKMKRVNETLTTMQNNHRVLAST